MPSTDLNLPTEITTFLPTMPQAFGATPPLPNQPSAVLSAVEANRKASVTIINPDPTAETYGYDYRIKRQSGALLSYLNFNFPCRGGAFAPLGITTANRVLTATTGVSWSPTGGPDANLSPSYFSFANPSDALVQGYKGVKVVNGDRPLSFMCRMRTSSTSTGFLMAYGTTLTTDNFTVRMTNVGTIRLTLDGTIAATSTVSVNDGAWHSVVVRYRGGAVNANTISIRIDGVETAAVTNGAAPVLINEMATVRIGSNVSSQYYVGDMTDIIFTDRLLFNETVDAWQTNEPDAFFDFRATEPTRVGLVLEWMMDDNQATSVVADTSGYNRDGAISVGTTQDISADAVTGRGLDIQLIANRVITSTDNTISYEIFTITWWLIPSELNGFTQNVRAYTGWGAFQFHINGSTGAYCGIDTINRFTPADIPSDMLKVGQPIQLTFSIDGDKLMKFYADGELIATKTSTATPSFWGGLQLGSNVANEGQRGITCGLRVYDIALSSIEVRRSYLNSGARFKMRMNDDTTNTDIIQGSNRSDKIQTQGTASVNTNTLSVPGIINKALEFIGGEKGSAPTNGVLSMTDFSISVYLKPAKLDNMRPISQWGNNLFVGFDIELFADGAIAFKMGNGMDFVQVKTAPGKYTVGDWVRVSCIADLRGNMGKIRIDGVEVATSNTFTKTLDILSLMTFASPDESLTPQIYEGVIDELRIYPKALTLADEAEIYKFAQVEVVGYTSSTQLTPISSVNMPVISDITSVK